MILKNILLFALLLTGGIIADEHTQQDNLTAQHKVVKRQLEQEIGAIRDWLKNSANHYDEGKTVDSQYYINALHFLTHNTISRTQWDSTGALYGIDHYFYQFLEQDVQRLQPLIDTIYMLGKQVSKYETQQ